MTTVESAGAGLDRYDASVAVGASGILRAFNQAGILAASDVHVARRLAQLAGGSGEDVGLGIAFAARAPRLGHVCVDLRTIRLTASRDLDLPTDIDALPWPDPEAWLDEMTQSPARRGRQPPLPGWVELVPEPPLVRRMRSGERTLGACWD